MNVPGVGERAVSGAAGPPGEPERRDDGALGGLQAPPERTTSPWDWRAIIVFERSSTGWSQGRKVRTIRERFGLSLTTYTLALLRAIDRPEALEEFPQLVARLRRVRDERRSLRTAERLGSRERHPSNRGRQLSLKGVS